MPAADPQRRLAAPPQPPSPGVETSDPCRYELWHEEAFWRLQLAEQGATIPHEQGLFYVAHMFAHPGAPVKNLVLAAAYAKVSRSAAGITEIWDERTGEVVPLSKDAVIQAPVGTEDEKEARLRLRKLAKEFLETIDDPTVPEPEKAYAREQLQDIANALQKDNRPSRDEYKKAADSVRNAIKYLLRALRRPGKGNASPPGVRSEFAEHIERYLLAPSRRFSAPKARKARGDLAGCLLYEPPDGVQWSVRL